MRGAGEGGSERGLMPSNPTILGLCTVWYNMSMFSLTIDTLPWFCNLKYFFFFKMRPTEKKPMDLFYIMSHTFCELLNYTSCKADILKCPFRAPRCVFICCFDF